MDIMESIAKRRTCRKYKDEQISKEELDIILQAANASPISFSQYKDVKLSIIQNKELIKKIEANSSAVSKTIKGLPAGITYNAPTIILISGKKEEEIYHSTAFCNASCIAENIMLAATNLSLGSVFILGLPLAMNFNEDLCREAAVPAGFIPAVVVALGKPATELKSHDLTASKINLDYID